MLPVVSELRRRDVANGQRTDLASLGAKQKSKQTLQLSQRTQLLSDSPGKSNRIILLSFFATFFAGIQLVFFELESTNVQNRPQKLRVHE